MFGDWLNDLFGGSAQPAMAGGTSMSAPPQPTPMAPAQPPDALSALQAFQQRQTQEPPLWRKIFGVLGGAAHDYSAFSMGHPEAMNGVGGYFGGIRQREGSQLAQNAQGQVLGELADPSKAQDALMQIARLQMMGVDTGPISNYLQNRNALLPKFTRDDYGNIWKETPGQPPQMVTAGPGKQTVVQPGQGLDLVNPYDTGGGSAPGAPASAPAFSPDPSGQIFAGSMVDPNAVATIESGNNPNAVSPKGAVGTMQTMPATLASPGFGIAPAKDNSAAEQTRVGQDYLKAMTAKYGPAIGLVAQNMGPGATDKWLARGGKFSDLPQETQMYVGRAAVVQAMQGRGQPAPQSSTPGVHTLIPQSPIWRDPTAAELEQHPGASQINAATGEVKFTPQSSIPPNPDQVKNVAKAIASYQMAPLTGFAMRSPYGQAVMAAVMQQNPQYQAEEFPARTAAYKAFKTGKQGDLVRSFNVGISHLGSLQKLTSALANGDIQAVNKIAQTVAEQTGSTAPTNFDAAKAIVGDEIIKAIVGGGGALADRENAQNQISRAKSPQQLLGVISTYKDLMAGQLSGLSRQYQNATGRNDFEQLLAPETKAELVKHVSGGAPQGGVVRVNSPADAAKLPKGTKFVTPDGRVLVRQ